MKKKLEEKVNIEDLILPSNTSGHTDQNIAACPSTMIKEEILDTFEDTGLNSNDNSPSEFLQVEKTEIIFLPNEKENDENSRTENHTNL